MRTEPTHLTYRPLTPGRWDDLVALFGRQGACDGCWCMWWRLELADFRRGNAANRRALRALVHRRRPTGLLAYEGGLPVGWCALGPREDFSRLDRSTVLYPIDEAAVWALPCLFVERGHRGRGVAVGLVRAAVAHAGRRGADGVEAYPKVPRPGRRLRAAEAFPGTRELFAHAGFRVVARRPFGRLVMRHSAP